ncbi:MAG: HU family DNA-binding protein [Bacteroidales bacterium]|nr:HU family DNA-binding protein [Bacteroidales bacterium]MCF8459003.1 HU family DNA-binding protein [Bacteroidales bacterium]
MTEKITLAELIDIIADETGESKQSVHDMIIETSNVIGDGLRNDGVVNISGLGKFLLKWHNASQGRNPQTGEEIEIYAHNSISFRASSGLKKFINRKYGHLKPIVMDEVKVTESTAVHDHHLEENTLPAFDPAAVESSKLNRPKWYIWLAFIVIILVVIFYPRQGKINGDKSNPTPQVEEINSAGDMNMSNGENENVADEEVPDAIEENPDVMEEKLEATEENAIEEKRTEPKEAPLKKETTESTKKNASSGFAGGVHNVQEGERLRVIAGKYYSEQTIWPVIFNANKEKIKDPDKLIPNMELVLPAMDGKPGSFSARDKQLITDAFIQTYLRYKALKPEKSFYYLWVAAKWEAPEILEKYKKEIDQSDLSEVKKIDGVPKFGE